MKELAHVVVSDDSRGDEGRTRDVLRVHDLRTSFFTEHGVVKAVDGVSFTVRESEIMAIVGESGSGKSVTALSIMRLIDRPGRILGGAVTLQGYANLFDLSEGEMQQCRGKQIAMVFQNPLTSLDPLYRVGDQLVEVVHIHSDIAKNAARAHAIDMLRQVGVVDAGEVIDAYPHQLGAGLRQRVAIAMALITQPEVLIADEPTTNLDALEQAHVLMLLRDIKLKFGTAIVLITHDFGVVATFADRVTVMYAGKIAESGPRETIMQRPMHPYTEALIGSVPMIGKGRKELTQIRGQVPNLAQLPAGCSFSPRCPIAEESCHRIDPELVEVSPDHWVRCLVRAPSNV